MLEAGSISGLRLQTTNEVGHFVIPALLVMTRAGIHTPRDECSDCQGEDLQIRHSEIKPKCILESELNTNSHQRFE